MSRYTITIVEHEVREQYRSGGFGGTEITRTDTQRYQQTVDVLDIEKVIEAVNRRLVIPRDNPEVKQ